MTHSNAVLLKSEASPGRYPVDTTRRARLIGIVNRGEIGRFVKTKVDFKRPTALADEQNEFQEWH